MASKSNVINSFENLSSKVQFWDVNLPKSPLDIDEDSEDYDLLCDLVRNQYLKRLRQTLIDNLNVTEEYQEEHPSCIQQCVDVCMAEMEKQALRRCMVASIYREGMSNMINNVKTCTKNSMLYVFLKQIIESKNELPTWDKYSGPKNVLKKQTVSIGSNTEQTFNKLTLTEKWTDSDNNLSTNLCVSNVNANLVNENESNYQLSPSSYNIESKILDNLSYCPSSTSDVPMEVNMDLAVENELNYQPSLSSYNVKFKISESNIVDDINTLLKSEYRSPSSTSDVPMDVNYTYNSTEFEQNKSKQDSCTTNNLLSINALLRDLEDSPEYEQSSTLDDRLISLGLTIENQNSTDNFSELPAQIYLSPNIVRSNKVNEILMDKLKSERVAKSYELQRSMNELPRKQKKRLNQKFNDLFGNGHTYESDPLSKKEEQIIAHKRIVKMVVEFMTPYYKAHRINRHLFKNLAKLISKNLMDRAYDPDEKTVARGVNEFFTGNRCIKTAEDIYQ